MPFYKASKFYPYYYLTRRNFYRVIPFGRILKIVLDSARYDGELDHICCSIQYPNSWFLNKAIERNSDQIFKDFIVLYIDLSILNEREAKYCPCNSSRENGAYICSDMDSIDSIFAGVVGTFKYPRSPKMLQCCPTDGQAEILIKGNIPPKVYNWNCCRKPGYCIESLWYTKGV